MLKIATLLVVSGQFVVIGIGQKTRAGILKKNYLEGLKRGKALGFVE